MPAYILGHEDGRWIAGPLLWGLWVTLKISAAGFLLDAAPALIRFGDPFVDSDDAYRLHISIGPEL